MCRVPVLAIFSIRAVTVTMIITSVLSIAMILASLGLGFLLRRLLVNSLKKTVLDNWITQTLGVVVIAVPLILGISPLERESGDSIPRSQRLEKN